MHGGARRDANPQAPGVLREQRGFVPHTGHPQDGGELGRSPIRKRRPQHHGERAENVPADTGHRRPGTGPGPAALRGAEPPLPLPGAVRGRASSVSLFPSRH